GSEHDMTPMHARRRATPRWTRTGSVAAAAVLLAAAARPQARPSARERADALLARMTLDEKLALVHGTGFAMNRGYAGHTPAIERLGIPDLYLADGPNGVGNGSRGVTAFPAAAALAGAWGGRLAQPHRAAPE